MTSIGTVRPTRAACGDVHLPGCYNPWLDATFCICGEESWPGEQGCWHSSPILEAIRTRSDPTPKLVGWHVYYLPALVAEA